MLSPLRYPGGKARLAPFLADIVKRNKLGNGTYVEPYAGGAGVAMAMAAGGDMQMVMINDADPAIHTFWHVLLHNSEELIERFRTCKVSVAEWRRQRKVLDNPVGQDQIDLAFATLYVNRTSRSGILKGSGVIGGEAQKGEWKIDARFYRDTIIKRIQAISELAEKISISDMDAVEFLRSVQGDLPKNTLIYLDPPYYEKGQRLYQNNYEPGDHAAIAEFVINELERPWVVSYDNVPEIRALYEGCKKREFNLTYTANKRLEGKEIMFFSKGLSIPREVKLK